MFKKVTALSDREIDLNLSQVVTIESDRILLSTGDNLYLTENSLKDLQIFLYGDDKEANPKASEHTSSLLNDLHKLLGGRGEAKPTTDRKARLKARLKDFSEDELKQAATNLGNDEFMQGANDNNKRYGTIDYLLRTSANVNKWLEESPQKKKSMF